MKIPFIGPAYQHSAIQLDCQECINLYPEMDESGAGKNVACLIGTPGLSSFATAGGSGTMRGLYTTSTGAMYAVRGNTLSKISTAGAATTIGSLHTDGTTLGGGATTCTFADNGITMLVADGLYLYAVTLTTEAFADVTLPDSMYVTHVTIQDHRFIVNRASGTQSQKARFYCSGNLDTTFDAAYYATAEGSPDALVAVISNGDNFYLFGTDSVEVWYNDGSSGVPFALVPGGHKDIGCVAAYSVALINDRPVWLGGSSEGHGQVWALDGYNPVKISTTALDHEISLMSTMSDAVGFCYSQEGHLFYFLTFPTADVTYCYDFSTRLWHRRAWLNPAKSLERHLAQYHAFFNNRHYVADRRENNGTIYELSMSTYTDDGQEIHRLRTCPHISNENKRMIHRSFQLDMEVGQGLQSGQGSEPRAMMQFSDDGGRTWSYEIWADIGAVGNYSTQVEWRKLGVSRDRVYRVMISDPIKTVIIGAYIEAVPIGS
jgi:hypothetical protein